MENWYNCYLKWCGDPSSTLEDAAHGCITIDADSKEEALDALLIATSIDPETLVEISDEDDFENIKETERFQKLISTKI